jgi:outer membrane protein
MHLTSLTRRLSLVPISCAFLWATTANAQQYVPVSQTPTASIPAWATAQNDATPAPPSSTAAISAADDVGTKASSSANRDWDVTVGGGIAVRPTYEGSNRYMVSPVPFVKITYDDMVSLGNGGLNAYWHHDKFRIGGGLTYNGGRKDNSGNGVFNEGDDRLNGLGNVSGALGLKAFASYDLKPVNFSASITKFVGSDNDGLLVDVGASLPYKLTDHITLTPHVGATWANDSYMQTFFGVTPVQSANSGFSQFNAGSGFKDVGAGINTRYQVDEHWFIGANADVKELTGDAAKSPISFSSTEATFMTMVGYHF